MTLQYSTQWDSFAHVGSRFDADGDGKPEIVFYNGFRAGEDIVPAAENPNAEPLGRATRASQAKALGIQNLAEHGAQGRGVLVDLHHHFGRKRHAVGYDELMRVLEADKVEVERGDMVCLYTGFADVLLEMKQEARTRSCCNGTCSGLDGRDENLLQWITDCGAWRA